MNILQVTPRYPPQSGGVETHVRKISEHLVALGHTVTVLTADAGMRDKQREYRNNVEIRRFFSLAPNQSVHFCPQITSTVRKTTSDIVHAHNYHSLPVFFAALGIDDQRFIVTPHYHGQSASKLRDHLLTVYYQFGRWAIQQADKVIAVSDWEREQLKTDFDVEATIIPNGVDVERFTEADSEVREQPYLLTVGRLVEYKGIQHIICALPSIPEYELVVAGSGPYHDELEQIATKMGVADQVTFLGYVDEDRLPKLYSGAAVYITLSEFEAYGMTVSEALAAGTPCVVRKRGALADWVEHDACVGIEQLTIENIVSTINRCIEIRPDVELLSWKKVSEQIEDLYCEVRQDIQSTT